MHPFLIHLPQSSNRHFVFFVFYLCIKQSTKHFYEWHHFDFGIHRFDASLTCPEPWSHVNRSIKLLTVKVCHLTQFAFLWSFYAQNGLVLFDKNNSRKSES